MRKLTSANAKTMDRVDFKLSTFVRGEHGVTVPKAQWDFRPSGECLRFKGKHRGNRDRKVVRLEHSRGLAARGIVVIVCAPAKHLTANGMVRRSLRNRHRADKAIAWHRRSSCTARENWARSALNFVVRGTRARGPHTLYWYLSAVCASFPLLISRRRRCCVPGLSTRIAT